MPGPILGYCEMKVKGMREMKEEHKKWLKVEGKRKVYVNTEIEAERDN